MQKDGPIVSWFIIGLGALILVIILAAMFTPIRGEIEPFDITVGNRSGKGWVYTPWLDVTVQQSKGKVNGVIVTRAGEPADEAGIKQGDIVKKVNQMKITTIKDFKKAVDRADPSKGILLDIFRDGRPYFITVGGRQNTGLWENENLPTTGNLIPLPVGAAKTIRPLHHDRGRCHNCHPFSGSQAGRPPVGPGGGLGLGRW